MASFVLVNMLVQIYAPLQVFALTGGPSQSSARKHKPVASTEMVDVFTGDFKYDIPLFTLPGPDGGYPFNLSYNSNVKMDQEASWVGLGWSLGPGAINRELNGVPDEFNGETVKVQQHFKPNVTNGRSKIFGGGYSLIGLGATMGRYRNNYNGVGRINSFTIGLSYGGGVSQTTTTDSQKGLTANFSYFLAHQSATKTYTSQDGLASITYGENNGVFFGGAYSVGLSQTGVKGLPSIAMPTTFEGKLLGIRTTPFLENEQYDYSLKINSAFRITSYNSYGLFNFESMPEEGGKRDRMDANREGENDILVNKDMQNLAIPRLTPDRFFVSSAGLQGAFKAYRTEIGRVKDPKVRSVGTMKIDRYNTGAPFYSDGDVTTDAKTGQWEVRNDASEKYDYDLKGDSENEPFYLKMENDMSSFEEKELDYIGGTDVGRFELKEVNNSSENRYGSFTLKGNRRYKLKNSVISKSGESYTPDNRTLKNNKRKRSTAIQFLKNNEISEAMPEYNIVYDEDGTEEPLDRKKLPGDHPAGYTILNQEGSRYTYGLPVYNKKQVYAAFSTNKVFTTVEGYPNSTDYKSNINYSLKAKVKGKYTFKGVEVPRFIYGDLSKDDERNYGAEFLQRTEIPEYAHSYLLTSVLGSDYVDVLSDGLSEDDLGYYVGFGYQKKESNYGWRAPFSQAMFYEGKNKASVKDNVAAYAYGEKETFYLKTAETKTHIAEFIITERHDARGAETEFQDDDKLDGKSYKLDEIKLYTKEEYNSKKADSKTPIPLKTVHFEYTYDLCGNVPNNDGKEDYVTNDGVNINENSGKLTLKRVYYTYKNNKRGEFSPYEFDYHENEKDYPGENPDYEEFMVDRWGDYSYDPSRDEFFKTGGNSEKLEKYNNQLWNTDFPYTNQNKSLRNVQTSVWNLKELTLPTGAKIKVDYEADDYAYVQDKEAMRMFKVIGVEQTVIPGVTTQTMGTRLDVGSGSSSKVYFELDEPFPASKSAVMKKKFLGNIDTENNRMFFDVDMTLKNINIRNALTQSIKGWAGVEDLGFDVENGQCVRGWVKVVSDEVYGEESGEKDFFLDPIANVFTNIASGDNFKSTGYSYHPFTLESLEYMLENMSAFSTAYKGGQKNKDKSDDFSTTSPEEIEKKARSSSKLSGSNELRFLYRDPFRVMKDKSFSTHMNPEKSVIRLFNPNRKKLGGGSRVKKITLSDNWDSDTKDDGIGEKEAKYGQVYDYTTSENGETISSGVASYEPRKGKEENPFYRVKRYAFTRKLLPYKRIDIEYPLNESYYPTAMVGYSKVKVTSLSTDEATPEDITEPLLDSRLTSGAVEYEFYTYKDFPIITEETSIQVETPQKYYPDLPNNNPLTSEDTSLGGRIRGIFNDAITGLMNLFQQDQTSIVIDEITAVQGYQVTTNDMHGKMKKITYLEQKNNGIFDRANSPYIEYNYKKKDKLIVDPIDGKAKSVSILDNKVDVLNGKIGESDSENIKVSGIIGMDWEVALDNREKNTLEEMHIDEYWFGRRTRHFYNEKRIATSVMNKVFHRHGILESVEQFDGQAKTTSRNEVYDPLTGNVVLSTIENQFDQTLYQYNEPAYLSYEGMGAASENLGIEFSAILTQVSSSVNINEDNALHQEGTFKVTAFSPELNKLVSGDEFVISNNSGVLGKMTYLRKLGVGQYLMVIENSNTDYFQSQEGTLHGQAINFLLTKSGKKNILTTSNQAITSKDNPLEAPKGSEKCIQTIEKVKDLNICVSRKANEYTIEMGEAYLEEINNAYQFMRDKNRIGSSNYLIDETSLVYNLEINDRTDVRHNVLKGLEFEDPEIITTDDPNPTILKAIHNIGRVGAARVFRTSDDFFLNLYLNDEILSFCEPHLLCSISYGESPKNAIGFYAKYKDGEKIKVYRDYSLSVPYWNAGGDEVYGGTGVEIEEIETDRSTQDNILNISANPFTDLNIYGESLKGYNPFRTGEKGVWKSSESYVYVQDRIRTSVTGDMEEVREIDLKNSGHMNGVTLFDPNQAFLGDCSPQWRKVSEITKYNADGYQLETKDILGIYSTALYNTKTEQLMAVVANSKYSELAFEDFEDVENRGGNFEFNYSTPPESCTVCDGVDIISAKGKKVIINRPYDETWTGTKSVKMGGARHNMFTEKDVFGTFECGLEPLYETANEISDSKSVLIINDDLFPLGEEEIWVGNAQICEDLPYYTGSEIQTSGLSLTTENSHTGKQSLVFDKTKLSSGINTSITEAVMEMRKLDLTSGKKYVLDGWTSLESPFYPDFNEGNHINNNSSLAKIVAQPQLQIGFVNVEGEVTWMDLAKPAGQVIENWQRISSSFTVPEDIDVKHVLLKFYGAGHSYAGGGNYLKTYYDDLRICPEDAEMTSNVYDEFYRVTARLDARNYATLFHYDDQGDMYLTQVETEKGIRTVSYNKKHTSQK